MRITHCQDIDPLAEDIAKCPEIHAIVILCIQLVKAIRHIWQLFDYVKQPRMGLPHLFPVYSQTLAT